jgi:hypothetical protein
MRLAVSTDFDDRPHVTTGKHVIAWCSKVSGHDFTDGQGIGWMTPQGMAAGVVYDQYNGANICMHVFSDKSKRWMRREYLWYCFYYPFVQLGVRRVTGLVPESNKEAIAFDCHLGFEYETSLKGAHPDGDLLVFVMRKDKCKWLGVRNVKT